MVDNQTGFWINVECVFHKYDRSLERWIPNNCSFSYNQWQNDERSIDQLCKDVIMDYHYQKFGAFVLFQGDQIDYILPLNINVCRSTRITNLVNRYKAIKPEDRSLLIVVTILDDN